MAKHENSGLECTVAHLDPVTGECRSCVFCSRCQDWVRPEKIDDDCPGPPRRGSNPDPAQFSLDPVSGVMLPKFDVPYLQG